jgi:hypothetical protein
MSFLSSLFPCFRDDPPPPVVRVSPANPWTIGPVINGVNYSQGMPTQPTPDGSGAWYFDFPTAKPGVHGVTRAATESGRSAVTLRFKIDGPSGFLEVDDGGSGEPLPGAVRLFLQRNGDDWGGAPTGKQSYRFYSQPMALAADGNVWTLGTSLTPEAWTNVNGQRDDAGFAALLSDLATVGFGFGGRFAMHGVIATGPSRFWLLEYTVS